MKTPLETYPQYAVFYKEEPLPGEEVHAADFQSLAECFDFTDKLNWGFVQINKYMSYDSQPVVMVFGGQYKEEESKCFGS
jgi:hypothetical protein